MNNIFKNMNHESAYILGYFWADANLTNNSLDIELNEKDNKGYFTFVFEYDPFGRLWTAVSTGGQSSACWL